MNVQYYDKEKDSWLYGVIKTATVETTDEIRSIHGDNLRYPCQDGQRCQVCGQSTEDKAGEKAFLIGALVCLGLAILCMIKYLIT